MNKREKQEKIEELLVKMNEYAVILRKYVHNNNPTCCDSVCPSVCNITHKLNLGTSIAWSISNNIHNANYSIIVRRRESFLINYRAIHTLGMVLMRHSERYANLYNNFYSIGSILEELLSLVDWSS